MLIQADLEAMMAAAVEAVSCQTRLAQKGENVVSALLQATSTFMTWDHYPAGEVSDTVSGAQYYYHAHPDPKRGFEEHGHFHIFRHNVAGIAPADGSADDLTHIIGLSMDASGRPQALFTLNHWMAEGVWVTAEETAALLEGYHLGHDTPATEVDRWIMAMLQLYKPEITRLLQKRDARVVEAQKSQPEVDVFKDRSKEILSFERISIEEKLQQLAKLLAGEKCAAPG